MSFLYLKTERNRRQFVAHERMTLMGYFSSLRSVFWVPQQFDSVSLVAGSASSL